MEAVSKVTQPASICNAPAEPGEEWRDLPDNRVEKGKYQVSNFGRIRTVKTGLIRKVVNSRDGYQRITFHCGKKDAVCLVHRLVALAFLPQEAGKPFIDHLDGDKHNNHVDNLKWCTYIENNRNPVTVERGRQGLIKYNQTAKGKAHLEHTRKCYVDAVGVPVKCMLTGLVYPSAYEAKRRTNRCYVSITKSCKKANEGIQYPIKGVCYEFFTAKLASELHD